MRGSGVAAFAALLGLVLLIYGPVLGLRPFEGDDLYILSWADRARTVDLLRVDPGVYPEWRPLAYATIWLEYQWATIEHLWSYYLVNLLLCTACGWLVHRVIYAMTSSTAAGLLGAAILLTSTQLMEAFSLIVERQNSLASIFGLTAWLVVIRVEDRRTTRFEWWGLLLLLAASLLSKEYGLAFTGATIAYGMWKRRNDLAGAAVAAAVIYAGLRLGLAGGALAPFCEEHGYFFSMRGVCIDGLSGLSASQIVYNVIATGVGSLLPGLLLDNSGQISIWPRWLLMSMLLLPIAVLGWLKGPKPVRLGVLVVAVNMVSSFMLYRSRNHVIAVCAISVAIGVGFWIAERALRTIAPSKLIRVMVIATLVSVGSVRALVAHRIISDRVARGPHADPCSPDLPNIDQAFLRRVWQKYNLQFPECAAIDRSH